jgi:hypothetical protein
MATKKAPAKKAPAKKTVATTKKAAPKPLTRGVEPTSTGDDGRGGIPIVREGQSK